MRQGVTTKEDAIETGKVRVTMELDIPGSDGVLVALAFWETSHTQREWGDELTLRYSSEVWWSESLENFDEVQNFFYPL